MFYYDFRMVGLLLRVQSPVELKSFFELESYAVEYCPEQKPDAIYELKLLPEDWTIRGERILETPQIEVYRCDDELHRYFFWSVATKQGYVLLASNCSDDGHYSVYIQQRWLKGLLPRLRISAFFALEQLLLRHQAFQLHASVIEWQGKGILFSAPSGTGKSTQAELWRIHQDASIINGDRAMIRLHEGQYRVYGSPYAGASGIYTNQNAPIQAIVVLSQAPENRLERLSPMVAFNKLYRECTVLSWDADFVDGLSNLLIDLVQNVPVYHLACRPDADAVETLKRELE